MFSSRSWTAVFITGYLTATMANAVVVNFADPVLEAKVRTLIGVPTGDILDTDLLGFTVLSCNDGHANDTESPANSLDDIASLEGLQHWTDLSVLLLKDQRVVDLTPIQNLNITNLNLEGNKVESLTPLASMTSLNLLFLGFNDITDISPLQGLTALSQLFLAGNAISDITALVNNAGINSGDSLEVFKNPLSLKAIRTDAPILRTRIGTGGMGQVVHLPEYIAAWDMDVDPGWIIDGSFWSHGTPMSFLDWAPPSGNTGSTVFGFDGDLYMAKQSSVTTTPFDCSGLSNVQLKYWRWANVDAHAIRIQVSNDGLIWKDVWGAVNGAGEVFTVPAKFSEHTYDISEVAANQSSVQIRWLVEDLTPEFYDGTWLIDDVVIATDLFDFSRNYPLFPDFDLERSIRSTLVDGGNNPGPRISPDELLGVGFDSIFSDYSATIRGLDFAHDLTTISLYGKHDLAPLVNNPGLSSSTTLSLTAIRLSGKARNSDIPLLQSRGVTVNETTFDPFMSMPFPVWTVGDAFEPDDTFGAARPIITGQLELPHRLDAGDEDWIQFNLTSTSDVSVETIRPYDFCDDHIEIDIFGAADLVTPAISGDTLATGTLPAGLYFGRLRERNAQAVVDFGIYLSIDANEPDDTAATAMPIALGVPNSERTLFPVNDVDWVTFTLGSISSIGIEPSTQDVDLDVDLFTGNPLAPTPVTAGLETTQEGAILVEDLAAGTYFARIQRSPSQKSRDYIPVVPAYAVRLFDLNLADKHEVDDTFAQASTAPYPPTQSVEGRRQLHNFHDVGDEDWLTFIALDTTSQPLVTVYPKGSQANVFVEVFDEQLGLIISGVNVADTGQIGLTPTGATLYVRLRHVNPNITGASTYYEVGVHPNNTTSDTFWGTLNGYVKTTAGIPIPGANVQAVGNVAGPNTPNDTAATSPPTSTIGEYRIPSLYVTSLPYAVTVSAPGFDTRTEMVVMDTAGLKSLNFTLAPLGAEAVPVSGALDFGAVTIGGSATMPLEIENASGVAIAGATVTAPAPFSIVSGTPFNLPNLGDRHTITVGFSPLSSTASIESLTMSGIVFSPLTVSGVGVDRTVVWADSNWNGDTNGLFIQPFNALQDALDAVAPSGTIKFKAGVFSSPITISNPVTLQAPFNGPVNIGAP